MSENNSSRTILEQAYFHINNGGLEISFCEEKNDDSPIYFAEISLVNFITEVRFRFNLPTTYLVDWMIGALQRVKDRMTLHTDYCEENGGNSYLDLPDIQYKDGQEIK